MYLYVNRPAQNLVEAASNGAIDAIKVVSSVAANLIAILGLIAFLNEALSYLGGCVGVPELSFQVRNKRCFLKLCLVYVILATQQTNEDRSVPVVVP